MQAYRHTENALNKPLGQGVWQSVTGLGKVQRRYVDAVSSQAAYYGIVEESGKLAIVTARLRIENREIAEAEWYIARDGDPGLPGATPPNVWNPTSLTENPPPERNLAKDKRLPRDVMIGNLDRDVLPRTRARGAELAAVRRQLPARRRDGRAADVGAAEQVASGASIRVVERQPIGVTVT
jgi:hypothetical protein